MLFLCRCFSQEFYICILVIAGNGFAVSVFRFFITAYIDVNTSITIPISPLVLGIAGVNTAATAFGGGDGNTSSDGNNSAIPSLI